MLRLASYALFQCAEHNKPTFLDLFCHDHKKTTLAEFLVF